MHRDRRRAGAVRVRPQATHPPGRRGRAASCPAVEPMTHPAPASSRDQSASIIRFLQESGIDGPGLAIIPLSGDASDRRYFRVRHQSGSLVLAMYAGPITFSTLPFANVAALLSRIPIPIPAIAGHADALGIVSQQDLGDI